jgi:4-amino-4-deoxy-L-arabinose transferase-like glycosyltransferase
MRKRLTLLLGCFAAWLAGTVAWLATQSDDPLLDHDEVYWIGSAYYYDLAFVQWDWSHPAWRLQPARENPPVSKYVIGLGLAVAGHHITTIDSLSYFYLIWLRWEKTPDAQARTVDEEKRARVVAAAPPGFRQQMLERKRAPLTRPVVQAARDTILVCAVLGSLFLFLLGTVAGDRLAGLIASQLLLFHPVAASAASHAMSDTVALLFSIAAAWAVLSWYRHFAHAPASDLRPGWPHSLAAGAALALACGAKMNSLVLVILAGVMVAFVIVQHGRNGSHREAIRAAAHGLLILAVGVTVFTIINPAILSDFPGGLAATVTEHGRTESIQVDLRYPHPVGLAGKLQSVISMGFYGWPLFSLMLAIVIWAVARRWHDDAVRFAVCWWVIALAGVTLWLPFAWPRYVLPLLAPSVWLVGVFFASGIRSLGDRLPGLRPAGTRHSAE